VHFCGYVIDEKGNRVENNDRSQDLEPIAESRSREDTSRDKYSHKGSSHHGISHHGRKKPVMKRRFSN